MTKINSKVSKLMACFLTIILFSVFATGISASASWYGWTYATFSVSVVGSEHEYDGNNVGLNWGSSTYNSNPNHFNNGAGFTITLQRKNWLGVWSKVGSVTVDRNSGGNANWTNVGSGTYRFKFTKADDGTTQYVKDIEMFSW